MSETSPPPKRFKGEETDRGECNPENSTDDHSYFMPLVESQEISSLVVDLVLNSIKDVDLLKKCRLVCKYWNNLVCTLLEHTSITTLREGDARLTGYLVMIAARAFGPLSDLPVPFKNFHIVTSGFDDDHFYDLVMGHNFTAKYVSISMNDEDNLNAERLSMFLNANKQDITSLEIFGTCKSDMEDSFVDMKFPNLEKVSTLIACNADENYACYHATFLNMILEDTPLVSLEIVFSLSPCLVTFLAMDLSKIQELHIFMPFKETESRDALAAVNLPALHTLNIEAESDLSATYIEHTHLFFGNIAPRLVKLNLISIYCDQCWEMNLTFPKLKYFSTVCPEDVANIFTPERFPCLEKLFIKDCLSQGMMFLSDNLSSHPGVRALKIGIGDDVNPNEIENAFPIWMANFARHFPNVQDFGIEMPCLASSTLLYIHRAYPNLRALRVTGKIDFLTLSGTSKDEVELYIKLDRPIKNMQRRFSIFDFQELETLDISRATVDEPTVEHCFSLIPKLKCLRIPWNGYQDVEKFCNCLQHLKKLGLHASAKFDDVIRQLTNSLPKCEVYNSKCSLSDWTRIWET